MARRTKKEKIIANLRRELKKQKNTVKERPKRAIVKPQMPSDRSLSSYVKGDLKRTLILTVLAISLELVLYLVLEVK